MEEIEYRLACLQAAKEVCQGYDDSGRACEGTPERILAVAAQYVAFIEASSYERPAQATEPLNG